jgi:hypothetical protein
LHTIAPDREIKMRVQRDRYWVWSGITCGSVKWTRLMASHDTIEEAWATALWILREPISGCVFRFRDSMKNATSPPLGISKEDGAVAMSKHYPTPSERPTIAVDSTLLPKRAKRGRPPIDRREILNAVLYVVRTGC